MLTRKLGLVILRLREREKVAGRPDEGRGVKTRPAERKQVRAGFTSFFPTIFGVHGSTSNSISIDIRRRLGSIPASLTWFPSVQILEPFFGVNKLVLTRSRRRSGQVALFPTN